MLFYLGTHMVNHAKYFERCFISINVLRRRRSDFEVQHWILDSGAFTELLRHGEYQHSVEEYATEINRWAACGNLEMAVTQDYMCEPFMLEKTHMTIKQHQELTIVRYDRLCALSSVPIMPVLQGYSPLDYLQHLDMYGARLSLGLRVGVGSICKRNGNPIAIIEVLKAIKLNRPDLRLHGFGVKTISLRDTLICSLLYSADSMAWSYAARKQGRDSNDLREAIEFEIKITTQCGKRPRQLSF